MFYDKHDQIIFLTNTSEMLNSPLLPHRCEGERFRQQNNKTQEELNILESKQQNAAGFWCRCTVGVNCNGRRL